MPWTTTDVTSRCPCGGAYHQSAVEVRMQSRDSAIILPDVRRWRCDICSGTAYEARELEFVEALFQERVLPLFRGVR